MVSGFQHIFHDDTLNYIKINHETLIPIIDGFLKNNDCLPYYRFIENYIIY